MRTVSSFVEFCDSLNCEYKEAEPLKGYTSFKIGGNAAVLVFPDSVDKLSAVASFCCKNNIPVLLLGKGSNVLVSDKGYDGVVINTQKMNKIELISDTEIYCECGASLMSVCRFALENSLSGMEFAYGIPGSAGGAAYMNAGAYGGEMKDVLVKCDHISYHGTSGSFENDSLLLGYRSSVYSSDNYIITSLTLRLKKSDTHDIKAKMDELMSKRKSKQPLEYPSAGSTFKRPEGYFAGALIEQCGLKGYSCGGAQVSEKHAGFVINKGNATCDDVLEVIKHCQNVVKNETGVTLEPEVKIIG